MHCKFYAPLLGLLWLLSSCGNTATKEKNALVTERFSGETMGTTFSITYLDSTHQDLEKSLVQLLIDINKSVSTYVKDSEISMFNQQDSLEVSNEGHFARNFEQAQQVYAQTEGWFNPTVMPLVNYWGFGYTEKKRVAQVDSSLVDSLVTLVQFEQIALQKKATTTLYSKPAKGVQLDFSAIAKGDAVDEVGRLLEQRGIDNYFIEIGGEIRTRGVTASDFAWRTAISQPIKGAGKSTASAQLLLELKNKSLATSGNYENYYQDPVTKQKYAHTINPKTGYPERNSLLSASVLASDCAIADAFATAFMAMGLERAWAIVNNNPAIDGYFIYLDEQGELQEKMTKGFEQLRLND